MKHNQPNNMYEASDILRYLSGDMSREEMYAIERTALDDELLADAIDGFIAMRKAMTDEAILAKVNPAKLPAIPIAPQHHETTPVVKINWIRRLSYAAAAILIAGSGWWFLNDRFIDSGNPQDEIASVQSTELIPESLEVQEPDGTEIADRAMEVDTNKSEGTAIASKRQEKPDNQSIASVTKPTAPPLVSQADGSVNPPKLADNQVAQKAAEEQIAAIKQQKTSKNEAAARQMMEPAKRNIPVFTIMAPEDTSLAIPNLGWSNLKSQMEQSALISDGKDNVTAEWIVNEAGKIELLKITNTSDTAKKQTLLQLLQQTEPWKLKQNKAVKVVIKMD